MSLRFCDSLVAADSEATGTDSEGAWGLRIQVACGRSAAVESSISESRLAAGLPQCTSGFNLTRRSW